MVAVLDEFTRLYPTQALIRSGNGPEFIDHGLRRWSEHRMTGTAYTEPGSLWQNGFAESFNGRLRNELQHDHNQPLSFGLDR